MCSKQQLEQNSLETRAALVAGDGPHRGRQRRPVAMGGDQPDSWEQKEARDLPDQSHGATGAQRPTEALHGDVLRHLRPRARRQHHGLGWGCATKRCGGNEDRGEQKQRQV